VRILNKRHLVLHARPGSDKEQREHIMADWYRSELRTLAATYFAQWTEVMGVSPSKWGIKVMRTKWGSCNHRSGSIWLNLELARKPVKCVEYIVVHELAHLLEHTHNERFVAYMDRLHAPVANAPPNTQPAPGPACGLGVLIPFV
jgi:predicted metal-dependent hydrolase